MYDMYHFSVVFFCRPHGSSGGAGGCAGRGGSGWVAASVVLIVASGIAIAVAVPMRVGAVVLVPVGMTLAVAMPMRVGAVIAMVVPLVTGWC